MEFSVRVQGLPQALAPLAMVCALTCAGVCQNFSNPSTRDAETEKTDSHLKRGCAPSRIPPFPPVSLPCTVLA